MLRPRGLSISEFLAAVGCMGQTDGPPVDTSPGAPNGFCGPLRGGFYETVVF